MDVRIEHLPADALGLSAASRHVWAHRPRPLGPSGPLVPARLEDIQPPEDRFDADERALLSERLETQLAALEPHVAVLDAVRALRQPGACLVLAGQQPGLFGGPLFVLWKALHAAVLARALSERWGVPVVPAFWNHGDDHDLAEVHHAHVLNHHLDLARVGLPGMSGGKRPLARIVLEREAQRLPAIAAQLAQLLPETEAREAALLRAMPRDGETLARAFTRSTTELLGFLGVLVIEPDWIREDLSFALAQCAGSPALPGALDEGAALVRSAGLECAIEPSRAALVFGLDEQEQRQALRRGGDGWRYDDEPGSRTPSELAASIVQAPARWSAGALLRPLVQDQALPVAAYVGGPGELAYHLQLGPVREALGLPNPAFVPRLSVSVVDAETRLAAERAGLSLAEVLSARGGLVAAEKERAKKRGRPEVLRRMRAIADEAAAKLLEERAALRELDRGLAIQLKRAADEVKKTVGKLVDRGQRVHQNRTGKAARHLRRLDNVLFPREQPQERVLSVLQFTARFGTDWLQALMSEIEPLPSEHLLVHLGDAETASRP